MTMRTADVTESFKSCYVILIVYRMYDDLTKKRR
jgi:hypothetical protein